MPAKAGISRGKPYGSAMSGWTSIMASKPHGVLYVGVTAHLSERIDQHCRDLGSTFCRRYSVHTLVLVEEHGSIAEAIVREKALKAWKRAWKIELIEASNPDREDLWNLLS